jgi:hypothetical protein
MAELGEKMPIFLMPLPGYAKPLGIIFGAAIFTAPQVHGIAAQSAEPNLETRIADLKAKTTALVSAGLTRLNKLSPQLRLAAPPVIMAAIAAVQGLRPLSADGRRPGRRVHHGLARCKPFPALMRPAAEKRQCTKSRREMARWQCRADRDLAAV